MPTVVILTEGKSNPMDAKTATGILRYRGGDVVAVIDSTCAGRRCQEVLGVGGDTPIVASLDEARADALLIGIAPAGGGLPESWREVIRSAIARGMDVINGLHTFLEDDPEFRDLAARRGVRLHDVRRPTGGLTVGKDLVRKSACHRVHTVGHDCGVGKMVVSLEIDRALREAGHRSEFIATGQTGIMISGWGVPADRVISDFVAGAVEEQILAHASSDFLLIEGQGSLCHPLYSGVTLGLLHGCAPQTMVMVFDPTRKIIKSTTMPVPPLSTLVRLYEEMASLLCPSRIVALTPNTSMLSASEAEEVVRRTEAELGLPTADVIRHGTRRIVEAVLKRHEELKAANPDRK